MSDQSQFYNPQLDRMALSGVGFILPRLTTAQRLGLTVGVNDAGLQLFDTTAGTIYLWTGSAWTSVGGGGSQRILATTITYSAVPTTRANQAFSAGTGSLPDPAIVLPGGTIQSVQYSVTTRIHFTLNLGFTSLGVVNDARVPFYFTVGGIQYLSSRTVTISSTATSNTTGLQQNINFPMVLETFSIPATGSTPGMSIRIGEPNYYLQVVTGSVGLDFTVTDLLLDATVQVYYLFE